MNKVLNNVIISLLVFFLTFCWMQYYGKIPTLSTLTAIGAAVVCCIIIQIFSKKPSKKERKAAKRGEIGRLTTYLAFSEGSDKLVSELLAKSGYVVSAVDGGFVAEKEGVRWFVAMQFDPDGVNSRDIVAARAVAKDNGCEKVYFFCADVTKNAKGVALASDIHIEIVNAASIYDLLNKYAVEVPLPEKKIKKNRIVLSYALNKKRFAYYFGSALFLTAISFVSYFPVYTLVWATILLVVAVYCLVNRRFNEVEGGAVL